MLVVSTLLLPLVAAGRAHAEPEAAPLQVSFLGWPREIPRSWSASRDAPAFALSLFPRDIRTAAGEFALLTVPTARITLRGGFYGLIELERPGKTTGIGYVFAEAPGSFFWRAAYGTYVAASFDAWARRLCEGCGLETSVMLRHESEHTTEEPPGSDGLGFRDRPILGDGLLVDAAARWVSGPWTLVGRLQNQFFLPDRSGYSHGPGVDVSLRFRAWKRAHLVAAGYAELLFGTQWDGRAYPDAHLVRGLLGVSLPSGIGDIQIHLSADTGHRKGLLVYTQERTLGMGVRLALGPSSPP